MQHRFVFSDSTSKIKNEEKYDHEAERQALDWLEVVTGIHVEDVLDLRDGVALCALINKISPGSAKAVFPKHPLEFKVCGVTGFLFTLTLVQP
jgi:hypothetical protein